MERGIEFIIVVEETGSCTDFRFISYIFSKRLWRISYTNYETHD